MSKNYTQLRKEQRYQIEVLRNQGYTQEKIAELIGKSPSTISRELKRNIPRGGTGCGQYRAKNAQFKTDKRHRLKPKQVKFSEPMKRWALGKITEEKWSPEYVSAIGTLTGQCPVSHEWLYQWIWKTKHSNKSEDKDYKMIWAELAHAHRHYKRGGKKKSRDIQIPQRVCITKRPAVVEKRKRLGDLEMDLMMGDRTKGGAILVILDRASLDCQLIKLRDKSPKTLARKAKNRLRKLPYDVKTVTMDNDRVFYYHTEIRDCLGAKTYFTRPYTSQDKGSVENRIKQIRRFIPKKADLSKITDRKLRSIQNKINNRPVRKFNYLTPKQARDQKLALMG